MTGYVGPGVHPCLSPEGGGVFSKISSPQTGPPEAMEKEVGAGLKFGSSRCPSNPRSSDVKITWVFVVLSVEALLF